MSKHEFDPKWQRQHLLSVVPMEWYLSADFDHARTSRTLYGHVFTFIPTAIRGLLVGLGDEAKQLLQKSCDWLNVAIGEGEIPRQYFKHGTEANRLYDLAQCTWLLQGKHDRDHLSEAVRQESLYYSQPRPDKVGVDLALPRYLEAGAYGTAIHLFESTGLSSPKNLRSIRTVGRMTYVLCLHHLHGEYSDWEIQEALERFLRQHVPEWLGTGLYPTVAQWMRLVHWNGEETHEAAKEALLHCYDYLPNVVRPS